MVLQHSTSSGDWHIRLFHKSVLKQAKLQQLTSALGDVSGKRCLDLGSDNGVISYFLRKRGGEWSSADLTEQAVESIRSLVGERVFKTDGQVLPFADKSFDVVVVIDMLEHVADDAKFVSELTRVLSSGGRLLINVPLKKAFSLLRWFKHQIGQTDEVHGHLRPGYSSEEIAELLGASFFVSSTKTYSRFFAELIDTLIVGVYSLIARPDVSDASQPQVSKGLVITEKEMKKCKKKFMAYSVVYPLVWAVSKLDVLVPFLPGYMLLVVAEKTQQE